MINYSDYKATLKDTSKDTSSDAEGSASEYMTNSSVEVVNFDDFIEAYFKENNSKAKKPDSVDALCMLNNKFCLIEFKNGQFKYSDISKKIGHSISVLMFKENKLPIDLRNNTMFILVYNKDSKKISDEEYKSFNELNYLGPSQIKCSTSFDLIQNAVVPKSKPLIKFGVSSFENVYFSEVKTMDKDVFNQYIQENTISFPVD